MKLTHLVLCAALSGCAWLQNVASNPVVAVQVAETDANLAIGALLDEWNSSLKPRLSPEDAASFQAKLDFALAKFRNAEAMALDAAKIAADGKASNWVQLVSDAIASVADVVALFDALQASHSSLLGASHNGALTFAHARLAHLRGEQ